MRKAAENSSLISVAPMIDWTDRHCRYFHRLLSPHARLYTEMITTGAILRGDTAKHLDFSPAEHPVALQLGGSAAADLAQAAKIGEDYGYDEINLNCGCPSDRVQQGSFGACLMAEPESVAEVVAAMVAVTTIPVTVKCRIGIDDSEDYPFLDKFITTVMAAGCDTFIIHARKAWLKGLSPKENREIPPLRYDIAGDIKRAYPQLNIILNGGISTTAHIHEALQTFDGVMIGREAYNNPYALTEWEGEFYGTPAPDRFDIARAMIPYIEEQQALNGMSIHSTTRHMLGLFNGLRGAKAWRQILSTEVHTATDVKVLMEHALSQIDLGSKESN